MYLSMKNLLDILEMPQCNGTLWVGQWDKNVYIHFNEYSIDSIGMGNIVVLAHDYREARIS